MVKSEWNRRTFGKTNIWINTHSMCTEWRKLRDHFISSRQYKFTSESSYNVTNRQTRAFFVRVFPLVLFPPQNSLWIVEMSSWRFEEGGVLNAFMLSWCIFLKYNDLTQQFHWPCRQWYMHFIHPFSHMLTKYHNSIMTKLLWLFLLK